MLHQILAEPRSPFASRAPRTSGTVDPFRSRSPSRGHVAARILAAPFAAVLGALAGLLYVLLLPICGIASIASAVAQGCWRTLREWTRGAPSRTAPPD